MQDMDRQKQKMESLGRLAGGVAHELNNMLQPILFAVDSIQKRSGDDDAVIKASSEKIVSCVNRAADIVDDILAFARQDNERLDFLNLEETFKKALLFSTDLIPKTVTVNLTECPDAEYWAWINKTDMIRVVTNLLSNASGAMNETGEVDVTLSYKSVLSSNIDTYKINDGHLSPGRYARISVKDHGKGIKKDVIGNIFDPFYTSKDIGEGTGLGLSIVCNILKNWSGGINVVSEEGKGSEFSFYIPIYRVNEGKHKL